MTYSIEGVILAFDMCEEIFRCIKPPNDVFVCDGSHWRTDLMAWNGSLVLLFDNPSRGQMRSEPRSIDMWVMNDNNGGGRRGSYSWIKYLTIENLNGMLVPLTFWKSDELLMDDLEKEKLVSYNIHNKEFRDLDVDGCRQDGLSYVGA
ncbi:hypothetical protein L484_002807 [Morus notabilis]|uniref:Uncharacterized protein n=1 Tax=Morus notabilis TaxID=981085 RepID=W9RJ83_9ROSA|nr:hypothetical protein L484_002807 [Morus notabilis]